MLVPFSIEPGHGLGRLRFGATPEATRVYLGQPDDVDESILNSGRWSSCGWYYRKLRLDVLFQSCDLFGRTAAPDSLLRLVLFTTSSAKITLWGRRVMGLPEKDIRRLFAEHGQPDLRPVPPDAYPENLRSDVLVLCAKNLQLDLHFCRGRLANCQWGSL